MEIIKDKEIYEIFLSLSYSQLKDLFRNAKSKQEQEFYMMLSNMVLQREQGYNLFTTSGFFYERSEFTNKK